MLDNDIENHLLQNNAEFQRLYNQHILMEQDLEALYSLKYFPPEVEHRIKELKIIKLRGKDRMQQIITENKKSE